MDSLSKSARAEVLKLVSLLQLKGVTLGMPFCRHLEDKVYELRAKDKDGIYRALYFAHTGKRFVLLHGFTKKTEQTPRADIEIALKRMKEHKNG